MHALLHPASVAPSTEKRRVLIVDNHDFFAACLRAVLDNESDLVVCDITATSAELGARVERFRPDLLVIDLSLGTENGLDLGRRLREMHVLTPILFISTLGEPTGAQLSTVPNAAFIAKGRKPTEFLATLRATLASKTPARPPTKAMFGLAPTLGKA